MSQVAQQHPYRFADEHFGKRLRRARHLQALSQRELAKETRGIVSERTVRGWEAGESSPLPNEGIRVIASVLRVSLAHLLWGEKDEREED